MKNPNQDIWEQYRIVSQARRYNNAWLVVRRKNNTIATSTPSIYEACRWVNSWGIMHLDAGGPKCNI